MKISVMFICGLAAASCCVSAYAAVNDSDNYRPSGKLSWDYWFAKNKNTFYAYYLEADGNGPNPGENSSVGLAISSDLINWNEYGTILSPNPKGMWNDKFIATGSVWKYRDKWRMLFTGHTFTGEFGMGLAESPDLKDWTRIGDGPVKINYKPFIVPDDLYWQLNGLKAGDRLSYYLAADPYVLPRPIFGWYYMAGNSFLSGVSNDKKGIISLMRSRDGEIWEDCGIISCPMKFERMETPQLWRHGSRWYLYFGAAQGDARSNHVYISDKITGPFVETPKSELRLPDGKWFYIAKIVSDKNGNDMLLGTVHPEFALSKPYAVIYEADGSLSLRSMENNR